MRERGGWGRVGYGFRSAASAVTGVGHVTIFFFILLFIIDVQEFPFEKENTCFQIQISESLRFKPDLVPFCTGRGGGRDFFLALFGNFEQAL